MICLRYIKQNTKILPNFLVYKFCGNAVSVEFWPICESPETLRKLCASIKLTHQEIRWNFGILRSDWLSMMILYWFFFSVLRKYFVKLLVDDSSLIASIHCVKRVRIRSFSGPYFPAFGPNTDQKNSEYGHFSRSDWFLYFQNYQIGSSAQTYLHLLHYSLS